MIEGPPAWLGVSLGEVIAGAVALSSMLLNWKFATTVSSLKLDFSKDIESLRKEFAAQYVPVPFDSERRQSIQSKVAELEGEVKKNRERIHQLANDFTTLLMGKLDRIDLQLLEKVRRMTSIETRLEALDEKLGDIAARLSGIERRT